MSGSDNYRRGSLRDTRFIPVGTGHGSMWRNCWGRGGNCGPRSPVGSTRPGGRFFCAACSEDRAARLAKKAEAV